MLPKNNVYGGWPTSGEIDIMEYRGDRTSQVDGTLHYGNAAPQNKYDGDIHTLPTGTYADDFHVFAVEWEPGIIRWYVDNTLFKTETQTPNSLDEPSNNAVAWPWDQDFFIILNLAVGGWYSGNPSTSAILAGTTFPQSLQVDYVRVYDMTPTTQIPYLNTVRSIPGKIEAEHYNESCNGFAYYDTDGGNTGGAFRGDFVDIETNTDGGAGYNVGWTAANEWLNYNVNIPSGGKFNVEVRVASQPGGKSMHIEMDGVNVTGAIAVPATGGWPNYQTITVNNIDLTAGAKLMKVVFDTDGINFNYVNFVAVELNPTISIDPVSKTYGDASFAVNASSTSPGAITYSITSGAAFASITAAGQVTITGAGTVTILASQAASGLYTASSKPTTLTIGKATPTLSYTGLTTGEVGDIINLEANSNSNGAITYSLVAGGTGAATLSGDVLTLTSAGTKTIQISLAATSNYNSKVINTPISITTATGITTGVINSTILDVFPNPATDFIEIKVNSPSKENSILSLCTMDGRELMVISRGTLTSANFKVSVSQLTQGLYIVKLQTSEGVFLQKVSR
jgi:hypothetical protein